MEIRIIKMGIFITSPFSEQVNLNFDVKDKDTEELRTIYDGLMQGDNVYQLTLTRSKEK